MTKFKIFRTTGAPSTYGAAELYLVNSNQNSNYFEIYATNVVGDAIYRIPNISDIQNLIDASNVGGSTNSLEIVADITARNALNPTSNIQVFVIDATGDSTVASGGATYIYRLATTSWIKISEAESLDVSLTWASLIGKPNSSVADIDEAVGLRHIHSNKAQLDKIGEDVSGNFIYNDNLPVIAWSSTNW